MVETSSLFRTLLRVQHRTCQFPPRRHISINSAINRSLRESSRPDSRSPPSSYNGKEQLSREKGPLRQARNSGCSPAAQDGADRPRLSDRKLRRQQYRDEVLSNKVVEPKARYHASEGWDVNKERAEFQKSYTPRDRRRDEYLSSSGKVNAELPPYTLRYTTAASEFLYGSSSVMAALRSGRRRLYSLYVLPRAKNNEGYIALKAKANQRARDPGHNLKIHEISDAWIPVLDKACDGRPHNGLVLEASPLPKPPVASFTTSSLEKGTFGVELGRQTKEDLMINGNQEVYNYKSNGWRHPMVLYADGIVDEGNFGAIIRSAYFLGIDAIAVPTRGSASLAPIVLKASAGAAEAIPIFSVSDPGLFLDESAHAGWRIYASDMVPASPKRHSFIASESSSKSEEKPSSVVFTYARGNMRPIADHYPLANHPTILMMGSEGSGLRRDIAAKAHYKVGIPAGREDEVGVDSLNVSVASALLCYEFMKKPKQIRKPGEFLF